MDYLHALCWLCSESVGRFQAYVEPGLSLCWGLQGSVNNPILNCSRCIVSWRHYHSSLGNVIACGYWGLTCKLYYNIFMMGFACVFTVFWDRIGEMLHLHVFLILWTSSESFVYLFVYMTVWVCAYVLSSRCVWLAYNIQEVSDDLFHQFPPVSLRQPLFRKPSLFSTRLEAIQVPAIPPALGNVWLIIQVLGSELWFSWLWNKLCWLVLCNFDIQTRVIWEEWP